MSANEKKEEKIVVCLDSSGHYPAKFREVTKEELERLKNIEKEWEYLDSAYKSKEHGEFLKEIYNRPRINIETILKYI